MRLSRLAVPALAAALAVPALAQEAAIPTQTLIRVDSKNAPPVLSPDNTRIKLDDKPATLTALTPVQPTGTQVAILIDDGLRRSASLQLNDVRDFINGLAPGTEVLVGYMQFGRVVSPQGFTTDHEAAAKSLRVVTGVPGESASPYFCLSDFVKHWPGNDSREVSSGADGRKARFVLMVTNGVDPYNGSTSILNQDSPYVQTAITDAQRAGVQVSALYYGDSGIRGRSANFSGQSYLTQLAEATGGESLYQGTFNPASFSPYLKQFAHDISETYVATFNANSEGDGRDHLLRLKVDSSVPKLKLRHPEEVRPGNHEGPVSGQ